MIINNWGIKFWKKYDNVKPTSRFIWFLFMVALPYGFLVSLEHIYYLLGLNYFIILILWRLLTNRQIKNMENNKK